MNTNKIPVAEIALLIHALDAVHVADMETTRQKLLTQLRGEMLARGITSFDSANPTGKTAGTPVARTRTRAELLNALVCDTHCLWRVSFLDEVNDVFGTSIAPRDYSAATRATGKNQLTLNGQSEAVGISSFDLAPALCTALRVNYEYKTGRGFQVRACVDALIAAGHDKP